MACETTFQQTFRSLCDHTRETVLLASVEELLGWDERTKLPPGGGDYRAEQITCLAGLIHQRNTDPKVGEYLAELVDSPLAEDQHGDCGAVIRHLKRDYEKQIKLPQALVEELARTASLGQNLWAEARKENDFAKFQPLLKKMVDLKRQQAEAVGYDESPYNALLDDYEPGARASEVTHVLGALRDELVPLIEQIIASDHETDLGVLKRNFPIAVQKSFGKQAAAAIGFDFDSGRLDVTDHPFCCSPGPRDIRLTARYDENSFEGGLFSILHEAGHGIYEQGLPAEQFGLPTGEAVSLGIHESQSRLWENLVGRSRPFWEHFFPQAQNAFPNALGEIGFDAFYAAVNDVRPSLIRVEADEATYNLHILIRFELEQALIVGDLAVADLPGAWNEKYQSYLGVQSPTDSDGVLQDVHWSAGLFGYFPTYALGNLYASQFFEQANRELGDLTQQIAEGKFKPLRDWLHQNIYQHGRRYSAGELAERITGHPLSHTHLMRHLEAKFEQLYELV